LLVSILFFFLPAKIGIKTEVKTSFAKRQSRKGLKYKRFNPFSAHHTDNYSKGLVIFSGRTH
ncbi:MAG: hypothetical protein PHO94_01965, partial [Petrimonas sp.]|nr:hypothetical protein [Petrimonas sp.]